MFLQYNACSVEQAHEAMIRQGAKAKECCMPR